MSGELPTNIENLGVGGATLFNDGDTIPIYNFPSAHGFRDDSTSNTSYENKVGSGRFTFNPDMFPNGPTYVIGVAVALSNTEASATAFYRLAGDHNTPDLTATEVSVTGTDTTHVVGETSTFDMSNADTGFIRADMKTDSGTNTASLQNTACVYLGIVV